MSKRCRALAQVLVAIFTLCIFVGVGFAQASSAEMPAFSTRATPQSNLPACVNLENDLAQIERVQKENSKTASKYDGYRNLLHSSTALELAARLTYAETLAANCPAQVDPIANLVASVIGNRIRVRRGDVKSVVFQRDQFASSLNIYSESRYRDFLCPSDDALWKKIVATMQINLEESKPSAPIPKDAVNYYLYQHSDRFKAPAWKLEEVLIADSKTRDCIRVFRDSAWK